MSWLQDVDVNIFPYGDCGIMQDYMDPSMLCAGYMEGGKVRKRDHRVYIEELNFKYFIT